MENKITAEQLKEALAGDFDKLIEQVVQAVNNAQMGRITACRGKIRSIDEKSGVRVRRKIARMLGLWSIRRF